MSEPGSIERSPGLGEVTPGPAVGDWRTRLRAAGSIDSGPRLRKPQSSGGRHYPERRASDGS